MKKKIKIAFVRGKFLNNFEGQNYSVKNKKISITAISSLYPLEKKLLLKVIKLFSPADLERIPFLGRGIRFIFNRFFGGDQMLFGLEKLAGKFDIFHTADSHYYYSYQLAKLREKGAIKKLISTSWEVIPFNNQSIRNKKRIKEFTQKQIDLFLCYTHLAKKALIKEGVSKKKIRVVPLGVDVKRFHPKKRKDEKIKILFIGRLVKEKGILDLLKAFKFLLSNQKNKKIALWIIGKGKLKREAKKFVIKNKLIEKVEFSSFPYQSIHLAYQQSDIFVLPSRRTKTWEEQYGMVLVEAMASCLPVVAYNTGAIKEIITEKNLLVKEKDIHSLSKSLKKLIENDYLRKKIGKMNRRLVVKKFDNRKTAEKIAQIYETLSSSFDKK